MFGELPAGGHGAPSWYGRGIVAVQVKLLAEKLPEGLARHALAQVDRPTARLMQKDFEKLAATNPKVAEALRRNPQYRNLSDAEMGKEIFVQANAPGKDFKHPNLSTLQREASETVDPRVFRSTRPLPTSPPFWPGKIFNPDAWRERHLRKRQAQRQLPLFYSLPR